MRPHFCDQSRQNGTGEDTLAEAGVENGAFTVTLKTLNVTEAITIVPVDKMSVNAPDHRVYAG